MLLRWKCMAFMSWGSRIKCLRKALAFFRDDAFGVGVGKLLRQAKACRNPSMPHGCAVMPEFFEVLGGKYPVSPRHKRSALYIHNLFFINP